MTSPMTRRDRVLAGVARVTAIAVVLLALYPIRATSLKLALIAMGVACWTACIALARRRPRLRAGLLAIVLVPAAFLLIPGRPFDHRALQREYVASMRSYLGTPYVWGGGNRLGIDCSGLVQRGLIDADLKQAVKTANPRLARAALALWWHNRSADALGTGYRGETRVRLTANSVNDIPSTAVHPGDVAIVSDGTHTLAYVGHETWIQALPPNVYERRTPFAGYPFNMQVRVVRWTVFETS